jgi:hypothetical protein
MAPPTRGKTYSLTAVTFIFNSIDISGYADVDDVISVTEQDDLFLTTEGADGEAVTSYQRTSTIKVVVRLMETSRAALLLQTLLEATVRAAEIGPIPMYPMSITDPNTGRALSSAQAIFDKRPDTPWGKAAGSWEFPLTIHNPVRTPPALNVV